MALTTRAAHTMHGAFDVPQAPPPEVEYVSREHVR
jgi:hypothetical protein